jgi:hypothetical protein
MFKKFHLSTKKSLANYHCLQIYQPPPTSWEWAFKALLSVVCTGHTDMPVCMCCVYFHQQRNQLLIYYHASALECTLNLVNPRYQTRVNRIAMIPTTATWHPLHSSVLRDKCRGEINTILLDSETAASRVHWCIIWERAKIVLTLLSTSPSNQRQCIG